MTYANICEEMKHKYSDKEIYEFSKEFVKMFDEAEEIRKRLDKNNNYLFYISNEKEGHGFFIVHKTYYRLTGGAAKHKWISKEIDLPGFDEVSPGFFKTKKTLIDGKKLLIEYGFEYRPFIEVYDITFDYTIDGDIVIISGTVPSHDVANDFQRSFYASCGEFETLDDLKAAIGNWSKFVVRWKDDYNFVLLTKEEDSSLIPYDGV